MNIPENIKALLEDPNAIKTVTTVDREGNPYSVPINSFSVLDDGNLAFLVLLDTCNTQKNMLNCYWFKKDVSVMVLGDWSKGEAFQIKGAPYKFLTEGPIWDQYLEEIWNIIPEANPSGVWLITPKEIRDQNYFARQKGEEERRNNWGRWFSYKGVRS